MSTPHVFDLAPAGTYRPVTVPAPDSLADIEGLYASQIVDRAYASLLEALPRPQNGPTPADQVACVQWDGSAWNSAYGAFCLWRTIHEADADLTNTAVAQTNPRLGVPAFGLLADWLPVPVLEIRDYYDTAGRWRGLAWAQAPDTFTPGSLDNLNNPLVEAMRARLASQTARRAGTTGKAAERLRTRLKALEPHAVAHFTAAVVNPLNAATAALTERTTP